MPKSQNNAKNPISGKKSRKMQEPRNLTDPVCRNKKIKKLWVGISIVLTLIFCAILIYLTNPALLLKSFNRISFSSAAIILILFGINYVLRAIRFREVLPRRISYVQLFSISTITDAFNNILPLKAGELYHIWILRKYREVGLRGSVSSLIISRVFDVTIIIFSFVTAYAALDSDNIPARIIIALCLLFAILISILVSLVYLNQYVRRLARYVVKLFRIDRISFLRRKLEDTINALEAFTILRNKKRFAVSLISSVLIFLTICLIMKQIFISLGLIFSNTEIILITAGLFLGFLIPINTVANLGTFEAIFTFFIVMLGIPFDTAISTALTAHALLLGSVLFYGICNYVWFHMISKPYRQST